VDSADSRELDLARVDDASHSLAKLDPVQARIIELRLFGRLSIEDTAEALKISPVTFKRVWTLARRVAAEPTGSDPVMPDIRRPADWN
jgi:DNA-directed RNA polymerase specialized sigma24 family protein